MSTDPNKPGLTPEAAWSLLLGKWLNHMHAVETHPGQREWCENRLEFTDDHRWIRTNLQTGRFRSGIERKMSFSQIAEVVVRGEEIVLSLGTKANPLIRPIVKLVVRLPEADCLVDDVGTVYRRVEQFRDLSGRRKSLWTFREKC